MATSVRPSRHLSHLSSRDCYRTRPIRAAVVRTGGHSVRIVRAALLGQLYLQPFMWSGDGGYLHPRQRPNHDIDLRARHVDQQIAAGTRVALTPELSVEVAARQATTRYDPTAEYDNTSLQRTLN